MPTSSAPIRCRPRGGPRPCHGRCGMSAGVVSTLAGLPAVGLEELNTEAALQTRVDRKYVVPEGLAQELLATFDAEVRILEMDGSRCFAYDSVYFDTAQLDSYLLAAHGRRRRYKIRTRTYVDSAISFLEVKTEGAREATVKERIPYELSGPRPADGRGPGLRQRNACRGHWRCSRRTARARARDPVPPHHALSARIRQPGHHRFGCHLAAARRASLGPGRSGDRWRPSPARPPARWTGTSGPHGVRPSRISKFATGMAALNPRLPANRWNQTLRRSMPLRLPQPSAARLPKPSRTDKEPIMNTFHTDLLRRRLRPGRPRSPAAPPPGLRRRHGSRTAPPASPAPARSSGTQMADSRRRSPRTPITTPTTSPGMPPRKCP